MQGRHLEPILQHHHQMVAPSQAKRDEAGGNALNAFIPLRIRQALIAVDNRQRLRAALDALQESPSKIQHDFSSLLLGDA
ncbi:hypothetical protein ACHAC9_21830 [Massilia sp. CMS3.1]|uniref:hypothetical protein n=1 Tax=Massilia sp. CMS3.1 TaxID=3373083 RepID=UPI003EE57A38